MYYLKYELRILYYEEYSIFYYQQFCKQLSNIFCTKILNFEAYFGAIVYLTWKGDNRFSLGTVIVWIQKAINLLPSLSTCEVLQCFCKGFIQYLQMQKWPHNLIWSSTYIILWKWYTFQDIRVQFKWIVFLIINRTWI